MRRLTKPEIDITKSEKEAVKKVARSLLQTLKEAKLVIDWRKKQQSRAAVYTTVKNVLDELPRAYTPELYQQKCDSCYEIQIWGGLHLGRVLLDNRMLQNDSQLARVEDSLPGLASRWQRRQIAR